jgi:hypothetical protein
MNDHKPAQRPYLRYFLLVVVLFSSYVLLNRFQEDNSATMAPDLVFNR